MILTGNNSSSDSTTNTYTLIDSNPTDQGPGGDPESIDVSVTAAPGYTMSPTSFQVDLTNPIFVVTQGQSSTDVFFQAMEVRVTVGAETRSFTTANASANSSFFSGGFDLTTLEDATFSLSGITSLDIEFVGQNVDPSSGNRTGIVRIGSGGFSLQGTTAIPEVGMAGPLLALWSISLVRARRRRA